MSIDESGRINRIVPFDCYERCNVFVQRFSILQASTLSYYIHIGHKKVHWSIEIQENTLVVKWLSLKTEKNNKSEIKQYDKLEAIKIYYKQNTINCYRIVENKCTLHIPKTNLEIKQSLHPTRDSQNLHT